MTKNCSLPTMRKKSKKVPYPLSQVRFKPTGVFINQAETVK